MTSAIVSTMALNAVTGMELNAADYGVQPGGMDCGAAVRLLIDDARAKGASRINFAPGEYHFHRSSALPMQLYISNHDQQAVHPVALPLVGLKDVKLCGNGAKFIFHGMMLPFVLMDSEDVTVNDISIDFAEPFQRKGALPKSEMAIPPLSSARRAATQWKTASSFSRIMTVKTVFTVLLHSSQMAAWSPRVVEATWHGMDGQRSSRAIG